MTRMGMDVTAVEQAARDLKAKAAEIGSLVGQVDRHVAALSAIWEGRDAHQFRAQTWPTHKRELQAVQRAVEELGEIARRNAAEQREASMGAGASLHAGAGAGGVPSSNGATLNGTQGWNDYWSHEYGLGWSREDLAAMVPFVGSVQKYSDRFIEINSAAARGGTTYAEWSNLFLDASSEVIGKLGPKGYIAKVGIESTRLAVDKAVNEVDWSLDATASTFSYIAKDPIGALSAGADAIVQSSSDFAKIFKWW